jgi:membrane protein EpsK
MSLLTIHLSVNLAVTPLFQIQSATKRVRVPAIVTLLSGAANLGLAIILAGPMQWGLYGVAAAGAVVLSAKNLVFTPLYSAHILRTRLRVFFAEVVCIVLVTTLAAVGCRAISVSIPIANWPRLMLAGMAVCLVYSALVFLLVLKSEERKMLMSLVPRRKS